MLSRLSVGRGSGAALVIIALAAIAKFASAPGQSFFLAVFVDDILEDTGLSRSWFSALYALATVVSATTAIWIGRLSDAVGVRAVWLIVATGLAAACALMSVAASALVVLLALCLMRGFGQGSFPLLGTILVASNFEAMRGRAMAVSSQGLTLAGIALPGLAALLIAATDWRTALQIVALVLIAVVLPLGLLAHRTRKPPPPKPVSPVRLVNTLRRPGVKSLLVILAATPLIVTALVLHSVSLLAGLGLDRAAVALALGLMAALAALGAVAGGFVADRSGTKWSLSSIGIALIAATGLLLAGNALGGAAVAGVLGVVAFATLGIAQGFSVTANGTVWARTYGVESIGHLHGVASAGQIAGAAVGPLVLALSSSATGGYGSGLGLLGGLAVAALVLGWGWQARLERGGHPPRAPGLPAAVDEGGVPLADRG